MSTAKYHRIPSSPLRNSSSIQLKERRSSSLESQTSPTASSITLFDEDSSERGSVRHLPAYDPDPRFYQPKPSPYARAALLIFIAVMFYIAFLMRAEIFYSIMGQQEDRIQSESEKWAEWAGAQDSY